MSMFSQNWHRVAQLRPKLRPHTQIHRHHYRGQRWYVLQDHATGAFHRFTPNAQFVIGLMDGQRTVQDIWAAALDALGDEAPSQDELIHLMARLHSTDVLLSDVPPDGVELFERFQRKRTAKLAQRWASPLALRFPLIDPDKILARMLPFVRPVFTWTAFVVWLVLLVTAVVLAASHWPELTENVTDRVLSPRNLFLLALLYPVIKLVHEFGHAFATKIWGGEVHEMGVMLLVLVPVPYVDASAASAFRSQRRRIVVGAAGIMVETFLAAIAMLVWINIEPGLARAAAYNVMLIAGVSTLLVNGNPLLRFDGYYILADLLEIPNLAMRSKRQLNYLVERYVFGIRQSESPATARGEATWFVIYGVAGFFYRIFLFSAIILFIAGKFFTIGILLALWASVSLIGLPAYKAAKFVFDDPRLDSHRSRSIATAGGVAVALFLLFFVIPFPASTLAEGVVWVSRESIVRAGANGFIDEVLVRSGERVAQGDALATRYDPTLDARIRVLELRVASLQDQITALRMSDRVAAEMAREQLMAVDAELERARDEYAELTLRAGRDGVLVLVRQEDLPGRFLRKGEFFGYVLDLSSVTARVVVPQTRVDLVRRDTAHVSARLSENLTVIPARVLREVPGASDELPSNVLGTVGGGQIAIDPRLGEGNRALQTLFQFDIELLPEAPMETVGSRLHVRFDHGYEPVGWQVFRSLRQLLLRRFRV